MREIVDIIYRGTHFCSGVECDVWEYIFKDGELWYDLIPTFDEECYEAFLEDYYFKNF